MEQGIKTEGNRAAAGNLNWVQGGRTALGKPFHIECAGLKHLLNKLKKKGGGKIVELSTIRGGLRNGALRG